MAVTTYTGYRANTGKAGPYAASPDGSFYFGEWWDGRATKIDATGTVVTTNFAGLSYSYYKLNGMACDADGNLYIGVQDGSWNSSIVKVTPAGITSTITYGVCFYVGVVHGNHLWGNSTGSDLIRVDLTTGTYTTFSGVLGDFTEMVCDSAGNLYARGGTSIVKVTPAGSVNTMWATVASETTSYTLGIDADDNLYTSSGHQLIKITPAGSVTQPWSSMVWGRDLTVANGNLYTMDEANWGQVARVNLSTESITNPWESVVSLPSRVNLIPGVDGIVWGVHYSSSNPSGNVYRFDADAGGGAVYEDIEATASFSLTSVATVSRDARARATDTLVNTLLANTFGPTASESAPETLYVGLSHTEPRTSLDTGEIINISEPTTGGYSRVAVTNATGFSVASRVATNTASIDFPEATGDYETTVIGVFIADAPAGGNVLHAVKIPARTVNSGDQIAILAGTLDITIPIAG